LANHKSALKRVKQSEKRRLRNKAVKTRVKGVIKDIRQAVEAGNAEEAQKALSIAVPVIDKAASKGVIHKNNAARKVSRLSKHVNGIS
jgi:small subunit ribosomal protein S20